MYIHVYIDKHIAHKKKLLLESGGGGLYNEPRATKYQDSMTPSQSRHVQQEKI